MGAEKIIRGALTPSLRIQTAPFGNIDLDVLGISDSFHFHFNFTWGFIIAWGHSTTCRFVSLMI